MAWCPLPEIPNRSLDISRIISALKPDVIIEIGIRYGGSALYFASLLDLVGHRRVISSDIETRQDWPQHPRVTYICGSSVSPEVVQQLATRLDSTAGRMVVLDSDHRKAHVDEELKIYSRFVTPGQYLIVEDTAINGHPASAGFRPGPFASVATFLCDRDDFVVDKTREK